MKIKSLLVFIIILFCLAGFAGAQTTDNSAKIAELQAQIVQLQAQVQALQAQQSSSSSSTSVSSWCHNFNINLGYAQSDTEEVGYLHTALDKSGISYDADTGNEYTRYTANAVKKFQAKYGVSQTGYCGSLTREKLNALYGCSTSSTSETSTSSVSSSDSSSATGILYATCQQYQKSKAVSTYTLPTYDEISVNYKYRTAGSGTTGSKFAKCAGRDQKYLTIPYCKDDGTVDEYQYSCQYGCVEKSTATGAGVCREADPLTGPAKTLEPTSTDSFFGNTTVARAVQRLKDTRDNYNAMFFGSIQGLDWTYNHPNYFYWFDYGPTTDYGSRIEKDAIMDVGVQELFNDKITANAKSSAEPVLFWTELPQLPAGTYHVRFTISTIFSTITGNDITITIPSHASTTPLCACTPSWQCGEWGPSSNTSNWGEYRSCYSTPNCDIAGKVGCLAGKPLSYRDKACTENWSCYNWSTCSGGLQTRTCKDVNNCGSTTNKPVLTQSCTATDTTTVCTPSWSCSDWSACASNSTQTRKCTDANKCYEGQPPLSQSCVYVSTTPFIKLAYPTGGESLSTGQTYAISWTSANVSSIYIYLVDLRKDPNLIMELRERVAATIVSNIANTGSYTWTVPSGYTGSQYQILVTNAPVAGSYNFSISNTFTIAASSTTSECVEGNWSSAISPSTCPSSGAQTKTWTKVGTCSGGVSHSTTETISCVYQDTTCTDSYWRYTLYPSTCPSTGIQTRTWERAGLCSGGVSHPATETVSCTYTVPTCTSFTYSDWSACSSYGIQTRTVAISSPSGCTGGNPITTQSCTPTCTDSNWTYSLSPSTCPSTSVQTKTWTKVGTCSGGVSHLASEVVSCTYVAPTCTSFTYSDWSACSSSGTQTRSIIYSYPSGCTATNAITTQSCTYSGCTDSNWTYTLSPTICPSYGTQLKTWTKVGTCSGGVSHLSSETVSCTYQGPTIAVTSPNGNETWAQGSTYNINWTSAGIPSDARVYVILLDHTRSNTYYISNQIPLSDGTYSWTVPETITDITLNREVSTVGSKFKIRIYSSSYGYYDESDNYFTITAPTAFEHSQSSLASISSALNAIAEQLKGLLGQ